MIPHSIKKVCPVVIISGENCSYLYSVIEVYIAGAVGIQFCISRAKEKNYHALITLGFIFSF